MDSAGGCSATVCGAVRASLAGAGATSVSAGTGSRGSRAPAAEGLARRLWRPRLQDRLVGEDARGHCLGVVVAPARMLVAVTGAASVRAWEPLSAMGPG